MKLPPQVAAVARGGRSWPARRSGADGVVVSATVRHDVKVCPRTNHNINVCVHDSNNPKCDGSRGVCNCGPGVCQCCQCGCTLVDGNCVCNAC